MEEKMQILRMKFFKTFVVIFATALISGGGVFLAMAEEVTTTKAKLAEAVKAKVQAEAWVDVVAEQAEQTLEEMAKYYAKRN